MKKRIPFLLFAGAVALGIGAVLLGVHGRENGGSPDTETDVAVEDAGTHSGVSAALLPSADWDGSSSTARAVVLRADGRRLELSAEDHEFAPLEVAANEALELRVELRDGDAASPVLLEADNGGILDGRPGAVARMPDAGGGVAFRYVAGGNTGKYTVCLSQGRRKEMMEIWVRPAGDES